MIRRSPTRIDLRLNDLSEYEAMKTERDSKKEAEKPLAPTNPPPWRKKPTSTEVQDRIGYTAQQTPQPVSRPTLTL